MEHCFGNVQYDLQYITNSVTTVSSTSYVYQHLQVGTCGIWCDWQHTSTTCVISLAEQLADPWYRVVWLTGRARYLCSCRTSLGRLTLQAWW